MVTIFGETGRYAADVDEEVGFHHDDACREHSLPPAFPGSPLPAVGLCLCLDVAVEQIELCALADDAGAVGLVAQSYGILFTARLPIRGGVEAVVVPTVHHAAHLPAVDFLPRLARAMSVRDDFGKPRGNVLAHHGTHEDAQCAPVVEQFFARQGLAAVAMAAHGLYVGLVTYPHTVSFAKKVHLRKEVSERLFCVSHALVTAQHQHFVHHAVARGRL